MVNRSTIRLVVLSTSKVVEITGIEPVVGKPAGFTVQCITIDASSPKLLLNFWQGFNEIIYLPNLDITAIFQSRALLVAILCS